MHGSIRLLEDEESESTRLSYRNMNKQKENERLLKSITSDKVNGESRLQFMPQRRNDKQAKENKVQLNQTIIGSKKKKKISLSKDKHNNTIT